MTDDERLDRQDRRTLQDILTAIIDRTNDDILVSPAWSATEALVLIDPAKVVQTQFPRIYLAAHLAFRQIARSLLREKSGEIAEDEPAQPSQLRLPGFELLQRRYPKPDGSGYVLLESLTVAEAMWNAKRLEQLGRTAIRHAEQLGRWITLREAQRADAEERA